MVDDESKPERRPAKHMQGPRAWDLKHNPAYAYYAYYTYANLFTLNKLREARGLNTFALRPHAGAPPITQATAVSVVLLSTTVWMSTLGRALFMHDDFLGCASCSLVPSGFSAGVPQVSPALICADGDAR